MKKLAPRAHRVQGHGGVFLNVWDYGGHGVPLLLCHCTGTVARTWDPVIARMNAGFHVYAVDSRGHGDSDRPASRDAYDWPLSGLDLLAVIDEILPGTPVMAAGHSGGGAHIAYAESFRPGVFSRVVLIEAIIGPREFFAGPSPLAALARRRVSLFDSRVAAWSRFAAKPPMSRWHPEALEAYIEHGLATLSDGSLALKLPGETEAWMYELGGAYDLYERLDALDFHALLAAGSESYGVTLTEGQGARLRNCEIRLVEGAHHFVPQERPLEVAAMLDEWLSDNQSRKTRNPSKNSA